MSSFKKLIRLILPYWKELLLYFLFNLLSVISSLFSITMVIPFLRILFGLEQIVSNPVPLQFSLSSIQHNLNYFISFLIQNYGNENTLFIISMMIVCLFFFRNSFSYLSLHFIAPLRNGVIRDLRNQMYQKILNLPLSFFTNERKGDILSKVSNDVQEVDNTIMASLQAFLKDPITILVYLSALFFMNYKLTLIILIALPFIGIILGNIGKSLKRKSRVGQEKLGLLISQVEETLSGIRIIKSFTAEDHAYAKNIKINQAYTQIMNKIFRRRSLAQPLTEFLATLVFVVILYIGSLMVLHQPSAFSPESFIAYIMIFSQIIPPAKNFTTSMYSVQKGMASFNRIEQLIQTPEVITDSPDAIDIKEFKDKIEFVHVYFKYNQDTTLEDINLTIERGKTIAIVGHSGAGKTTLVDLLPRFFDVTSGEILIDGIPIKKITITSLRRLFGIVSQEPILFNDTFFNNIAIGKPDATMEEVIESAKIAYAHDFIMETQFGYYTNIGEGGNKLSGGQKQRISIARAVLANPPILILDEATSSLDSESEKIIQEALKNIMKNRTSIVIAHRLSSIVHADEIVVLHQGKIVEKGTHAELLDKNGYYKKLYDTQFFINE
ncbi:MAG: ABC transporter ATP-binding protein/permease [Bacteroidales bacterium]|nr:ABC transporter ATP-binding protein/permease [Bacteroidales bacterium]